MPSIGKRKRRFVNNNKQIKMNSSTTMLLPTTSPPKEENLTFDEYIGTREFRRCWGNDSCSSSHIPYLNLPHQLPIQFNGIQRGNGIPQNGLEILPCSRPYDQLYCFNGGQCYNPLLELVQEGNTNNNGRFMLPFCRCAQNFHGPRCEHLFDANFYGIGQNMEQIRRPSASPSLSSSTSTIHPLLSPILLIFILFIFIRCKFIK